MGISRRTFVLAATFATALTTVSAAQTYPTANDPRNGLSAGYLNAGESASGMRLVSFTPKPAEFDTLRGLTFVNSDLAFRGNLVYQGNFAGFSIWDVSNPAKPVMAAVMPCITSQGDPTIVGNLLFISAEGNGNRNDCAKGGVQDAKDHMAGVRIFDVSNPKAPKLVKNVQTCKGSHTHTLIPSPKDKGVVYLYVSGSQAARPDSELAGCKNGDDPADPMNSIFRLDVIKVPLANPTQAEVVTGARIFTGMEPAPRRTGAGAGGGRGGRGGGRGGRGSDTTPPPPPTGPRNCHDVTAYPAMNLLAGACSSYGLLVDISNPEKPVRLDAKADTNFSLWHTAVFSNDGKKVVFTDEWGGGTSPNCQATSMMEMGGNTTLTIDKGKYTQHAYFKIPSSQTAQENCVSHNGGLVPVPGRDIMVQGWYQGGVDVIDFTDPDHPFEIAFFDRGPANAPLPPPPTAADSAAGRGRVRGAGNTIGGSWGAYWYNGLVYSSELARGFDILEILPSDKLSANELAAAKTVTMSEYNPQSQPKITWPPSFPKARAFVDQLERSRGLRADRIATVRDDLTKAERTMLGSPKSNVLRNIAKGLQDEMSTSSDRDKLKMLIDAINELAK